MSKNKKNQHIPEVKKSKKIEDRQQLQLQILQRTEQKVEKKRQEKYSDKNLDRENEKIKLLNGSEVTIQSIQDFISKTLSQYESLFPVEFYSEIYRLNNWDLDPKAYIKPRVVGKWTNELIYSRFPKNVLPALRILNPYGTGESRAFKHFQWLNEEGKEKVSEFIQDAIGVMKKSTNWYDFREKYYNKFRVGYQLNALKENGL